MGQLPFLLLEAARGFRSNKFLSATSVMTIGICASVFALSLLILTIVIQFTTYRPEDAILRVYLTAEAEPEAARADLETKLKLVPGVDSLVFIDKEEALEEFRADFGDDMLLSLDVNPLPHSYRVFPEEEYATSSGNDILRRRLARLEGVEEISAGSLQIAWLDKWKLPLWTGSFLLILFVGGALALIIHNAVKLNLYARKVLVENMKYCGAGEAFIITPFLLEGVLLGLCGSFIGIGTLVVLTYLGGLVSPQLLGTLPLWGLAGTILGLTVSIAAFASAGTVMSFLKETQV